MIVFEICIVGSSIIVTSNNGNGLIIKYDEVYLSSIILYRIGWYIYLAKLYIKMHIKIYFGANLYSIKGKGFNLALNDRKSNRIRDWSWIWFAKSTSCFVLNDDHDGYDEFEII